MEKNYDIIAVLGYTVSDNTEEFPSHVLPRLQKVAQLFQDGIAPYIALCGKWSITKDRHGIVPTQTEAEKMKQILLNLEIPEERIFKEEYSKDTIGNAYYLKKEIVVPKKFTKILVVCADYHVERASFIFQRVFGNEYTIDFIGTQTEENKSADFRYFQKTIYHNQKEFLSPMNEGEDSFLDDKLYSSPVYKK